MFFFRAEVEIGVLGTEGIEEDMNIYVQFLELSLTFPFNLEVKYLGVILYEYYLGIPKLIAYFETGLEKDFIMTAHNNLCNACFATCFKEQIVS